MTTQLFTRYGTPQTANTTTGAKKSPGFRYTAKCTRCGGAGGSDKWKHTGWTCYQCGGSGLGAPKVDRLYTAEELAKLNARAERVAAKKAAERAAEAARVEAERAARRAEFLAASAEELAKIDACIEDDRLTHSFRMTEHARKLDRDPYLAAPVEPTFWSDMKRSLIERADISDRMAEVIENGYARVLAARADRAAARHVGKVGERVRGVKAEVVRSKHIATISRFPLIEKYLVAFKTADGADLVWFTGSPVNLGEYTIDFTVKDHGEYQGKPQTVVQRVTFK